MKYLDLSGLEHLIGRLIQWRSTDWTLNVNGATPTVVSPSVADNAEFWSKIAAGDSVTLTFSNGDPTRKAFVISVNRDGGNSAIFVAGTGVKLTQYILVFQAGSMVLRSRDMPTAADLSSKLTASGTTEDLTVDTEGNLGLTYGNGFIERLCKDLGKTDVAKDALQANGLLGEALGNNQELGKILATSNTKFYSMLAENQSFISKLATGGLAESSDFGARLISGNSFFVSALGSNSSFISALATGGLASNSSFIEALATGELPKNNYFGTSLALYNSAFATALPKNSAFTTALAQNAQFCSELSHNSDFTKPLAGVPSFYATLAANSGFRDGFITNLSAAQVKTLKNKLGV